MRGHFGEVQVRNRSGNLTPLLRRRIIRRDGRFFFVLCERFPPSTGFRFSTDTGGPTSRGGGDFARGSQLSGIGGVCPKSCLPSFRFALRPATNTASSAGCILIDLHGLLVGALRLVIFDIAFLYAARALALKRASARSGGQGRGFCWRRRGETGPDIIAVLPETRDQLIILGRGIGSPSCPFDISLESNEE